MKKKFVMVDIEADGPCPGLYSMLAIGAVVVDYGSEFKFKDTFYGELAPITDSYVQETLDVCGFTHKQTLSFPDPLKTIQEFDSWLSSLNIQPMFVSDNNGFDCQFINYYFWRFLNRNPFGHSSTNLGSLYKGAERNMFKNFKHLRKTKHTHNALADALGNAEAMMEMKRIYKLKW